MADTFEKKPHFLKGAIFGTFKFNLKDLNFSKAIKNAKFLRNTKKI